MVGKNHFPAVGKITSVLGPLLTLLTFLWFFFLKIYIGRLMKSLSVLNKEHAIAKVMSLLPLASSGRVTCGLAPQDSLFHTVAAIFISGVY